MNGVNKTLYIPLYGKAYVSRNGIILEDKKAEEIWAAEGFHLKGKSKSKWLAYYMGMRSAVYDRWLKDQMEQHPDALILHIGCGMDSRINRVGPRGHAWYDVDFPDVITERKRYYQENNSYHMLSSDARENAWIQSLPKGQNAIIVMEGVCMYFQPEELNRLLKELSAHLGQIHLLMDCYTGFAAKASKYKNPINEMGVTRVYGVDDPHVPITDSGLSFIREYKMTPESMIMQLKGMEKAIFKKIFGGKFAKKMYRMYEYQKN